MKILTNFYKRHEKRILGVFTAVLFITALLNIYFVVEVHNSSNDECLWILQNRGPEKGQVVFRNVKVDGVTWRAGIRDGDILVKVEDYKVRDPFVAQRILNQHESGDTVKYIIEKEGELMPAYVRIKKVFNFGAFGFALLGLIWLCIGFIVLISKPGGRVQYIFYLIGAAFVLTQTINLIADFNGFIAITPFSIFIDIIWIFGASFLPFLLIEFFWLFPRKYKLLERPVVKKLLIILPVLFLIAAILIRVLVDYTSEKIMTTGGIQGFFTNLSGIALIIGFISLLKSYRRLDKESRKPYFVILFAYIIGLAGVYYTTFIAPQISDIIYNSPEYYTPVILIALIPIGFTYSIFKYHLMDISVFVKNAVTYGAATLTIAAIYFLVIYVLGQSISTAIGTEYQGIIAGLMFVVFALIFQSTKDKFQDFITRKFYPEQFIHQKVLVKFSSDVSTVVGMENILDSMQSTFVEALKIKTFGILIRDHKREGMFMLVRSTGLTSNKCEINGGLVNGFIYEKQQAGLEPVIDSSEFEKVFPDQSDRLHQEEVYTIIPMIIKNNVTGLLLFGLKYSGSQFAGKDLQLLSASASQAAVALENARLYKSEAEKLKLEREIDLARQIQQSLLPESIPNINGLDICGGMIPAMQVGGDYYDLIPVSDGKLFVIVGDVSGKGLPASLYMAKIQTMVQMACVEARAPKDILIDINRRLYKSIERHWFITMTVALIDTEEKTVTVSRAGHVPLIKSSGGAVEIFKDGGMAVGIEKGPLFDRTITQFTIPFKEGDTFIFYSDGVTEAINQDEDFYGEERFAETLRSISAQQSTHIMEGIWRDLNKFRGSAEQNDDMTLVIVKISRAASHRQI